MTQSTNHVLMIRPTCFGFNKETAENNVFQNDDVENPQEKALEEFDQFVTKLQESGINVTIITDTEEPCTPDSIFPNNWFTTHNDGTLCLYPMFAPSRRNERKPRIVELLRHSFHVNKTIDFTEFESENRFLEGTGSIVLDRESKVGFACLSPRTDPLVLKSFSEQTGYEIIEFTAVDKNDIPIYHTNVIMSICSNICIICLESIKNAEEKELVLSTIQNKLNKKVIDITLEQVSNFCGNVLELRNIDNEKFLIASLTAYNSFTSEQLDMLNVEYNNHIISTDISTIERVGGGSARCMIAELHVEMRDTPIQPEKEDPTKRGANRRCC